MPEPYLRSKGSSSSGRSSRSSSSRKPAGTSSSRKSSSSSSSKSKAAAASKKKATKKKTAQKQPIRARPALLYGLAMACAVAVGALSIQAIHATTPMADGFEAAAADPGSSNGPANADAPVAPPAAVELMRKQGWVVPASLELYERERRKSALPPEIAAVPETLIESAVLKPQGGGYAPPPPIAGVQGAGAVPGQAFPSDAAVPIQGGDATVQALPQDGDEIQSMLAGINNQRKEPPPPQEQPSQQKEQRVTLLQAQAQCADKGFIARIACNDRVRTDFCTNRWNEVAGCEREEDANF